MCSVGQLQTSSSLPLPRATSLQPSLFKNGSRSYASMVYRPRRISSNRFDANRIQLSTPLHLQESVCPVTRTQLESSTIRLAYR